MINKEIEKEYNSLVEDEKDVVYVGKDKFKIGWLRAGAQRKISSIITKYSDDDTLQHRCAAICVLNSFWKITLFYWIVWRWFFFVKEYTSGEMASLLNLFKKKVQHEQSLRNMVSLIGVRDTLKSQTMSTVEATLQKLVSEQSTQSEQS